MRNVGNQEAFYFYTRDGALVVVATERLWLVQPEYAKSKRSLTSDRSVAQWRVHREGHISGGPTLRSSSLRANAADPPTASVG